MLMTFLAILILASGNSALFPCPPTASPIPLKGIAGPTGGLQFLAWVTEDSVGVGLPGACVRHFFEVRHGTS
jgi:hypothetical protein